MILRRSWTYGPKLSISSSRTAMMRRALSATVASQLMRLTSRALATAVLRQKAAEAHVKSLGLQPLEEHQQVGPPRLTLHSQLLQQAVHCRALPFRPRCSVSKQRLAHHVE